jgi:hypothetical protein
MDIIEANQYFKMRMTRIYGRNPANSSRFFPIKTATQHYLQANELFWLDFTCENLVYPCNTPPRDTPHN